MSFLTEVSGCELPDLRLTFITLSGPDNLNLGVMDEDLQLMSKEQLIDEVKKLRAGIREHRDSTGQNLCWHHPKLWALLQEKTDPKILVPEWPEFLKGCIQYRKSLDEQYPAGQRNSVS
jgi:hypothetical protein